MKRVRKLLAVAGKAVGVCLLLVLAVVAEENLRGYLRLRRVLNPLRAQGEPLTLADLHLPPVPKEGNAAPAILQAAKELEALAKANPVAGEGPRGLRMPVSPGQAKTASQASVFTGRFTPAPPAKPGAPATAEWLEVERQLANAREPLDRLREALRQPTVVPLVDYSKGFSARIEPAPWRAGFWLLSEGTVALHAGRYETAAGNIIALFSLADYERRNRLAIGQLTANTAAGSALLLLWEALQQDGWTDDQLAQLQTALAAAQNPVEAALGSFALERTMVSGYFDNLRRSPEGRIMLMRMSRPGFFDDLVNDRDTPAPSEAKLQTLSWLWAGLWSWQDEALAHELEQRFLMAARPLATDKSWTAFARRLPLDSMTATETAGGWDPIAEGAQPRHYWHLLAKVVRTETERQMALAAIGLKRYALRNGGALPPSLDALVPTFLPEVPIDWMDGKPLRYRPGADSKTFLLYSVGTDGRDDGGDPTPPATDKGKRKDLWTGRDAVWPAGVMPPPAASR